MFKGEAVLLHLDRIFVIMKFLLQGMFNNFFKKYSIPAYIYIQCDFLDMFNLF